MTLAELIYQARKRAGLSQEELADQLGVTRQAVSKWETGKSVPDTENIRRMTVVLAVSADYFLGSDSAGTSDGPEASTGGTEAAGKPVSSPDLLGRRLSLLLFLTGVAAIAVCSVVFLIRSLTGESRVYATIQVTDFTIAAVMFLLSLIGGCGAFLFTQQKK